MPRPTAAQLVYGSCTVLFSTLAMLLLSQASSVLGIAVIAVAALVLGLLVAVTVPTPAPAARRGGRSPEAEAVRSAAGARTGAGAVREHAEP